MALRQKARNVLRAFVQRFGPEYAKRCLWNFEFSSGQWNCLDRMGDERGHVQIEKHANHGHILDLGCGSGTTSVELNPAVYRSYTGIDISDVAVHKAKARAHEAGRSGHNEYYQANIATYVPRRQHDLILFGDSLYYLHHIDSVLKRYSEYLSQDGVFLVRIHGVSGKLRHIFNMIENQYRVVETELRIIDGTTVGIIVFRPL